jgi:DNA-binding GntR family transcriptional regulator
MTESIHSGRRRVRQQLNEEAATYLREMILARKLVEGQLISVEQVVEALDMSATPVREAILRLVTEGFLILEPRRGFIVAPLREEDLRDLWQIHAYVAGELAAKAAERADPSVFIAAKSIQNDMFEAASRNDHESVEKLNFEIHRLINHAADSAKLQIFLRLALKYVPSLFTDSIPGWVDASLQDHVEILQALEARDSEWARRSMRKHIQHAEELFLAHHSRLIEDSSSARAK